jgi:glycosyltransferase involved in cell wall biosynthesis
MAKRSKAAKHFAQKREVRQAVAAIEKQSPKNPKKKIKLLYHGDSPKVNTGFGVVAREVLARLQATGKYEIHSVGINDKGDPNRFPEIADIIHYPLPHYNEDPYGAHRLPEVMEQLRPDVIFTLNDIWVLDGSTRNGTKGWFINSLKKICPNTPWVLYFPVDSRPWTMDWANLAFSADKTIVYSRYAEEVLAELHESFKPEYIHHGVSLDRFNVLPPEERKKVRDGMGVKEDEFLLGFVSRNQPRKNPAAIVEIFKMANEGYRKCTTCDGVRNLDDPKCEYCGEDNDTSRAVDAPLEGKGKCYLHFNFEDNMGLKMHKVINDNKAGNGIVFNPGHSIPYGLPAQHFNAIFNALDCHLLTTTAEGFGLTVLEGMACGVPTMATRTTAVTELLEQGGGYPIIPKTHFVFEDAANTRKHIIDHERALIELAKLYQDWKQRGEERWGPDTKTRIDKGLAFANEFTWDKAAELFDEKINAAIDARVSIIDNFTEDEVHKMMFLRAGTSGDILQTLPAVKKFREAAGEDAQVVYAMPSGIMKMFEGKMPWVDKILPMDRLNDRNPENKKIKINMVNFAGPERRYEEGAYPFIDRSRPEIYCLHTNVGPENASIKGMWNLTEDEEAEGKKVFDKQVPDRSTDDFVVGLAPMAQERMKAWGDGTKNWEELRKYLKKAKMKVFMLDTDYGLVANLGAFKQCNMVVAVDSDILDFLHALDIPTTLLISPFWRIRVKDWDNAKIIAKDDLAKQGARENFANPSLPSPFMESIGVGEVFSPILTYNKMWKQARAEALKPVEEDKEATVEVE